MTVSPPKQNSSFINTWWYAIRPHTLGASIAPLIIACGALIAEEEFKALEFFLCLAVALFAQIASNIANDYFDYKGGKDTDKRVGFDRLLTKGVVTPRQMLVALTLSVFFCTLAGALLLWLKGWIVLVIGIITLAGIFAYSTGPFPLSHMGLGDLAVVLFFGLIPVLGTYYVIAGVPPLYLFPLALGIGVWEANILVVNNYRDYYEDLKSGKRTLVARIGQRSGPILYTLNAFIALFTFILGLYIEGSSIGAIITSILLVAIYFLCITAMYKLKGRRLNGLLKLTGKVAVLTSVLVFLSLLF
ncbi:1,4-dihydroxy-2-naphthoate octaprenyltransferase [Porphyromonas sp.]|uniref:1,4-dihydroxy-2-naphthoate octaprenyltransferase n=1 Tax=Porphyromonas sp. TaxID=1924944 RepID=UPI0026DB9601|nr:1,4-dihydroxy-2-naphthoate octaprenyltransferase [Porphyromonas sp.]MDO4695193.1 1,4-dihydroxy-2-naphthoate octaprenyltransferase [Porphyromonas sp.]MDO4771007.1 1,4-dihydroxy-2-naphthoate octaprenyltransferase [Porphyromonas sp.]